MSSYSEFLTQLFEPRPLTTLFNTGEDRVDVLFFENVGLHLMDDFMNCKRGVIFRNKNETNKGILFASYEEKRCSHLFHLYNDNDHFYVIVKPMELLFYLHHNRILNTAITKFIDECIKKYEGVELKLDVPFTNYLGKTSWDIPNMCGCMDCWDKKYYPLLCAKVDDKLTKKRKLDDEATPM